MEQSSTEGRQFRILKDCLDYCEREGLGELVVALPGEVGPDTVRWMMERPAVKGVVLSPEVADAFPQAMVGRFDPSEYSWVLPDLDCRTFVYVGPRNEVSFRMVREAMRTSGGRWIVHGLPGVWRSEHVLGFVGKRVLERLQWRINRSIEGLGLGDVQRYLNLRVGKQMRAFAVIARRPLLPVDAFVPNRIVFVNSALAWGGAERQLVNTMRSLRRRGGFDISLVCEHLNLSDDHRFFHHQLEGVRVEELSTNGLMDMEDLPMEKEARLKQAVDLLPAEVAEDVMRYAVHFLARRPGVVHAWQDSTSIKAGLAALLVGVPRIVLGGRNMAPIHFTYFQYYMRAAYRALAASGRVTLVNNSKAGARDYEKWLNIKGIRAIYNGLNEDFIRPASADDSLAYRRELGIPEDARIIGSIFRLYEEKDPHLWIRTAGLLAQRDPDLYFLLVGTGPMKDELIKKGAELGFSDRLLLPGTHTRPAVPLSLMDVFMLTSRYEGTPNVVMEAQKLGVPVVCTDAGGVVETMLPGQTGLVVRQRSPELLADAVLEILGDSSWRERVREKGPAFIQSRFGLDRMVMETLEAYGLRGLAQEEVAS